MAASIEVSTSGRLHMGFFDLHGGLGRKFGSIGLSLAEPNLVLSAKSSKLLNVSAADAVPASVTARVYKVARQILDTMNVSGAVDISISESVPEHSGLGSGTQMALATGAVINYLYQLNLNTMQLAALTGRGRRSGVGISAFDYGGLLIDGGRVVSATHATPPPMLARYDFPEEWAILLIFDTSEPGIHGERERIAFNELPVFSESLAAHLCRHVLMQAMPALVEQDLIAFGQSIQVLQQHVGDYFLPVQGGRYASRLVSAVLERLETMGAPCFGQSSWGPTGFAIFANQHEAELHLQQLKTSFTDHALSWKICSACNHGAKFNKFDVTV
ncbi:beta-ribofuranosylaminobenzene 5'-phosphate synthase family protein [Methylotenera sp. L2L1]|uniref:beta-ribofuranosylaminobenzene 5'-phosphate synthase family protein n=1 Tax=Methylotenera sp. L2L1 TaxID=1502770 RepID=UPI000564DA68|nr:beta-ribofuranosylaminobenzene 5'-phosphate synthase family protein [Methylotenera sp. L2L1]